MRTRSRPPARSHDVVAAALVALAVCTAFAWWWFSAVGGTGDDLGEDPNAGRYLAAVYDPPTRPVERALVSGDGQVFAALGHDPLALRPEGIRGGAEEQAYRYQRPAYGWLGWLGSAGRSDAVPWALIAVTVASAALLVAAGGRYVLDRGVDPRWALLLLLSPGVVIDLTWVGPETLGAALVVAGLTWWFRTDEHGQEVRRDGVDWRAVACFAAAGLCRETLLAVPMVLVLADLVRGRAGRAVAMATSAAPYAAWVLYLRIQIGAWPRGSVDGRLSFVPFGGLAEASGGWVRSDALVAALILGLAVVALVVDRRSPLRPLIWAHLGLASVLGAAVWTRFPDFSRVLLPLSVLSVLAILTGWRRGRGAPASRRRPRCPAPW